MPLTRKGRKVKRAMTEQYGLKKGTQVFHASAEKGTITGVHAVGGGSTRSKVDRAWLRKHKGGS
jgi:hypothetical protein